MPTLPGQYNPEAIKTPDPIAPPTPAVAPQPAPTQAPEAPEPSRAPASMVDMIRGSEPVAPSAAPRGVEEKSTSLVDMINADQDELPRLKLSHDRAIGQKPDQAARVLKLSQKTGLPSAFVEENLDEVDRRSQEAGFSAEDFRNKNPKFASWVSKDPNHYPLVKNDLGFFGKIEKGVKDFAEGWGRGVESVWMSESLADINYRDMESTIGPSDISKRAWLKAKLAEGEKVTEEGGSPGYFGKQFGYSLRQAFSTASESAKGGAIGALAGAGAGFAAGGVGAIPGAAAGLAAGGLTAAARYTYQMEAASAFEELREMKDLEGKSIDIDVARNVARGVGAINAVIETGSDALIARLLPGAGKVIEAFTKKNINQTVKAALANPTKRALMMAAAKKIGSQATIEGLEEFTQALVGNVGREAAQAVSPGTFAPDSLKEDLGSAASQGVDAIVGTLFVAGLTHSPSALSGVKSIKKAEQTKNFFLALGEGKDSESFKSLPEKAQEAVASMTKGSELENVFVDTETWSEYWQGKGVDPKAVASEIMGDNGKAFEEAQKTGTSLQIPTDQYARRVAVTEHNEFFADELRRSPEEMNAREGREFFQKMDSEAKIETAKADESENSSDKVVDDINLQLQAAGETPQNAEAMSKIFRFFGVTAEKMGVNAFDLYKKYGVKVSRPDQLGDQNAGPVNKVYDPMDSKLDRLRKGDLPDAQTGGSGKSLIEFLISKGGISESEHSLDGDITSLETDKDRNTNRKLVRPEGMDLDRAAVAAHEAGYIDEADPAKLIELIGEEKAGKRQYAAGSITGNQIDSDRELFDIRDQLQALNIDLSKMDNESVKRAIRDMARQATDPESIFLQDGTDIETVYNQIDSPNGAESAGGEQEGNVINAFSRFAQRFEQNTGKSLEEGAPIQPDPAKTEKFAARFGDDKKALKAIAKAQNPKLGPYVSDKNVPGIGWTPNFESEPTGTIGPARISSPHDMVDFKEIDPLAWADIKHGATKQLIEKHAVAGIPLVLNTSSDLVGNDSYIAAMPADTTVNMFLLSGHSQNDRLLFPGNGSEARQMTAVEKLREAGIKVNVIKPTVDEYIAAAGGKEVVEKNTGETLDAVKAEVDKSLGLRTARGSVYFQKNTTEKKFTLQTEFPLPPTVKVIQAKNVLDENPTIKSAAEYAKQKFQGKSFSNSHTGWSASVGRAGIDKIRHSMSASTPGQILAFTHLDELLNEAVYVQFEEFRIDPKDPHGAQTATNIKGYHEFISRMDTGEKSYLVRLKIAETNMGEKLYDSAVVENEKPSGTSEAGIRENVSESAFTGLSEVSINDFMADVKAVKKQYGYFQLDNRSSSLDMSRDARLKRAEAMGFDTSKVWYHGTNADFGSFDLNQKHTGSGATSEGYGSYFTTDPEAASGYAPRTGGNVVPVYLKKGAFISGSDRIKKSDRKLFENIIRAAPDWENSVINYGDESPIKSLKLAVDAAMSNDSKLDALHEIANVMYVGDLHNWGKALANNGIDGFDEPTKYKYPVRVLTDPSGIRSVNADFDPDNSASTNILHQSETGTAKGRIRFGADRQFYIDLFKTADLSTFLHESGHLFLEVLGDVASAEGVPQQIKDDYAAVLKWMGVESRDQITTEQHEQFARGFEAYLRDGKAPSAALRSAFAKFQAWLSYIYKKLSDLNVELSPEIRGVFDRMLAAEEEIAAVQNEMDMRPLVADAKALGLSDKEAAVYQAAFDEAKQASVASLTSKLVQELERERKVWWKEQRAKVRASVAASLNDRKEQLALSVLQNGTLPDGTQVDEGVFTKISRESIVEQFGADRLKELPKPYVYAKEGGIHVEQMADDFGFGSGDELLHALSNTEKAKVVIERETDAKMKELYGDIMSDGTLHEKALESVHNEKRAEFLHMELKYLAENKLNALKGMIKKISRRIPSIETVRTQANSMIGEKKVRDIRPILYQRAEVKAARAAVEAFTKGDFEKSFDEKQKELFNHELYRAAVSARELTDKAVDYARKFEKPSTRSRIGKAGGDYLEQIDVLLDRFEFKRGVSLKAIDERKSLVQWSEDQKAMGIDVNLPARMLNEAYRQNYKEMTYGDLTAVIDSVKMIEHLARLKNKLLAAKDAREFAEVKADIMSSLAAHHDISQKQWDLSPGLVDKWIGKANNFRASHTRMESLVLMLDGNKPNGPLWRALFLPTVEAEQEKTMMTHEYNGKLRAIFDAYSDKEKKQWYSKPLFIQAAVTQQFNGNLTKPQLLSIALNWGNEYNRDALMRGYGWNEANVQSILSHLDSRDWEVVKQVWSTIDEFWPMIQKLEKDIHGVAPEKVQATPFAVRSSLSLHELPGGYFPIKFDSDLSVRALELKEDQNIADQFGGSIRATTKQGHAKARTDTGGKPLNLKLSVISDHVNSVIHDLTHRRAVIDIARLSHEKDIYTAIENAAGKEAAREMRHWIKRVAGAKDISLGHGYEDFVRTVQRNATIVNIGLKFTSGLIQVADFPPIADKIGNRWLMAGMKEAYAPWNLHKLRETWKFVTDRSEHMSNLIEHKERDARDALTQSKVIEGASKLEYLRNGSMVLVHNVDLAIHLPAWLGAYHSANEGHRENIEKGDEKAAVLYADHVVRTTLAAGEAKDRSRVQEGSALEKALTMFYSPMNIRFNQMQNAYQGYRMDKDFFRLAQSTVMLWVLPVMIEELVRGRLFGGNDDDEYSWFDHIIMPLLTFLPAHMVGARDLVRAVEQAHTSGKAKFSPSPVVDAVTSLIQGGVGVTNMASAALGGEDTRRKDMKDAFMASGYAVGLPTRQTWMTMEYLYDWNQGNEQPANVGEGLWRTLVTGKPRR